MIPSPLELGSGSGNPVRFTWRPKRHKGILCYFCFHVAYRFGTEGNKFHTYMHLIVVALLAFGRSEYSNCSRLRYQSGVRVIRMYSVKFIVHMDAYVQLV